VADSRLAVAQSLITRYGAVDNQVTAALAEAVQEDSDTRRRRRMVALYAELSATLPLLLAAAKQWAQDEIRSLYASYSATDGLDAIDEAVASSVQSGVIEGLQSATETMLRTAGRVARAARSQASFDGAVFGSTMITGSSLRAEMSGRGISAVIYKNGARHRLGDYTDMLLRTAVVKAANLGAVHGGVRRGVEWFEILDGAGCGLEFHEDAEKADGLIVPAAVALANPLSHPRCVRWLQERPDLNGQQAGNREVATT
jgi:hypothetical protein